MLRRGTKRKEPGADAGAEDARSGGGADYARNLSNFRTLARQRESMRLKLQAISSSEDSGGAAAQQERHLKEKVALEMSLVEGTAKFIMACKNQKQVSTKQQTRTTVACLTSSSLNSCRCWRPPKPS